MRTALPLIAAALLATPSLLHAQSRWVLEPTVDVALPTQDLGDADLGTGLGFGATARYRFLPHLAAYAGWEWHHFSSEDPGLAELDFEDTGYAFGLRFEHALGSEGPATGAEPAVWVKAGGMVNHIEVEDEAGVAVGDTDHGLGWEAGLGMTWPLGARVAIAPAIRYRSLSRELTLGGTTDDVTLAYLTIGAGVRIGF